MPERQGRIPAGLQRPATEPTSLRALIAADDSPERAIGFLQGRQRPWRVVEPSPPARVRAGARHTSWQEVAIGAANWAAQVVVARDGLREYFRLGIHAGIQEGLEDESIGHDDYVLGEVTGKLDPDAREIGEGFGRRALGSEAEEEARRRVVQQFTDLTREPAYFVSARPPYYTPELPALIVPEARELLAEFPLEENLPMPAELVPWVADWGFDATRLYDAEVWSEVYRPGWDDPHAAFLLWAQTPYGLQYLSWLSLEAQHAFEELFVAEFDAWLDALYALLLEGIWEEGYEIGWSYGAFVREEWQYRVGYARGFALAAERAAEEGYDAAYEAEYERAYRDHFREWSENPKPAIEALELFDAGGDGRFQAGETVTLRFVPVNYGGAAGRFPVLLRGPLLEEPVSSEVLLRPRRRHDSRSLDATLEPSAAPGAIGEVHLGLGTAHRVMEIEIGGVMRLAGGRQIPWP